MEHTSSTSLPSSIAVIIQPEPSEIDPKSNELIMRLGWKSFIFGACAFLIHYISIDHLANFSPFNAGLIVGFFLMIAGLASMAAGYKKTSYRTFIHAQIWSFIVNIILAPGLTAVSIAALIIDREDIRPICEPTVSSSLPRVALFGNSFEVYPSNVPCLKTRNLYNLAQILNTIQLILGVICFVVHMVLFVVLRKVIKQMKMNQTEQNKFIFCTQTNVANTDHSISYADAPPRYEDLPPMPTPAQ